MLSRTGGDEHPVSQEAGQQPQQEPPGHEPLEAEGAIDLQQLDDDVEDRARGQGQEGYRDKVVDPRLSHHRAEERRPAADEAEQREEAPARQGAVTREGRDDPEPLGGVVKAKADNEDERQADLARGRRLTDGEAFGEVVQADSNRDEEGEGAAWLQPVT